MRRVPAPRASTAVAVVAAIVAVLAVMFPGLGLGQTTSIHGGVPSDVFTLMKDKDCAPIGVTADGVGVMPLQLDVGTESNLLVYFSFELAGLDVYERVQVNPQLDGTAGGTAAADFDWLFTGGNFNDVTSSTVMSSFPDVEAGPHTVDIYAAVSRKGQVSGQLHADLADCVLTVFAIPVAP